jgi:hypothetical protein
MSRKALIGLIVAVLSAAVAISVMTAAAGTTRPTQLHWHGLLGAWQANVALPAPAPPVHSLQVYSAGGGFVETSDGDPRSRSVMYGSWERIHGRLYASTGVHFLFDPQTGAYAGKRKINRTLELASDGQSYSAVAKVTMFDANGNAVGTFTARGTGERLQVERIPDLP